MTGDGKILPRKAIGKGQTFIQQGDEGIHAYFIQEGAVEIFRKDSDGGETIIGQLRKGQVVGEMALIAKVPRTASVRAIEPTTVVVIQPETLDKKFRHVDPLVKGLIETFIAMIRRMNEHYKPPVTGLNEERMEIARAARTLVRYVPALDHEDFQEEIERLLEDLDELLVDYVSEEHLEKGLSNDDDIYEL